MRTSSDIIEIDNYVILNTLQMFSFLRILYFFLYLFGLKHAEPNIGKIFKTNIILITKYLNLNWNFVKSFNFYKKKMIEFK